MEKSPNIDHIRKHQVKLTKKEANGSKKNGTSRIISQFISQTNFTSFKNQHFISFTHSLQHYCFSGPVNLHNYVDFSKNQDMFRYFIGPEVIPRT